jgi:hypothetical protein
MKNIYPSYGAFVSGSFQKLFLNFINSRLIFPACVDLTHGNPRLAEKQQYFQWQKQLSIPQFYSPVDSRSPGEYFEIVVNSFKLQTVSNRG